MKYEISLIMTHPASQMNLGKHKIKKVIQVFDLDGEHIKRLDSAECKRWMVVKPVIEETAGSTMVKKSRGRPRKVK